MRQILIFLGLAFLTACQSMTTEQQAHHKQSTPSAYTYTGKAHPLGIGQQPDARTSGYAYLLLADSLNDSQRATQACQALFSDAHLSKPAAALNSEYLVTYLPVSRTGDFRRTSALFKWGMCKRLEQLSDAKRESQLLEESGYAKTRGPVLMAIDAKFSHKHGEQQSIVADLSMVPNHELATVIRNWVDGIASDKSLWHANADLGKFNERLNQGLTNRRVALSLLPEARPLEIAFSKSKDQQPAL